MSGPERESYVEKIMIVNGQPRKESMTWHPDHKAFEVYRETIQKARSNKEHCLITLRDQEHILKKSEIVKPS
jgi:hypothetical protein